RQLDKHCALRVVDLAGRRNLETDEALEIGQAAPVEVDVVDEPDRRKQEQQRKERRHEPHALSPTHRLDDRKHFESLPLADSSRRHPPCLWDLGLRPTSAGRSTCCIRSRPLGCSLAERAVAQAGKFGARMPVPSPVTSLTFESSYPVLHFDGGETVTAKCVLI